MCGPPTVYSRGRAQQGMMARAEASGRDGPSFCALVTARAEASGREARSFCGLQVSQCLNIWKEWGGCSVLGGD